jgi:BirA family transcriptional regulator, biotin operon repressor / biotin---[acetyl-CoA-carboxylase] ligase
VVFNQQQFETAFQEVGEHLSLSGHFQGIEPPQGIPLHAFETVLSTNRTLWELIDQGAIAPTVVLATQQTAGRGQRGRQWQSDAGGLYLSVALAPNLPASHSTQLTLCSAWGIATALRSYSIPVFIKWPNDLLLLGRKLGGILTETRIQQGQITKAVVGVGINWRNGVPESGINLQSFCEEQLSLSVNSLEMLAAIVLHGVLSGYQRWSDEGMERLLPSYLELFESQGCHVIVDGKPGIVIGITPMGELRVSLKSLNSKETASEICLKPGTISLGYRR